MIKFRRSLINWSRRKTGLILQQTSLQELPFENCKIVECIITNCNFFSLILKRSERGTLGYFLESAGELK